ncbi:GTP-binding protein [Collybia nuda]|uniref:GTP-binding protein n=1 Tax=Collybia nuda TaxID=64659 RepID=A0A9P5Y015_9AGAR|nr:GTP-binding protein [Collybia nuda]
MSGVTQANVNLDPNFDAQEEQDRWEELARKAKRFRILIIGRTNAGKTTILKKFCDSTDEPEIYNNKGEKIDRSTIEPTTKRGIHDINNEMIFQSNPGFIFHDSRGFEAGGSDELQKVKKFMFQQSLSGKLVDQVHVIWYCIPLDDSRPFQHAEKQFFSEVGTGKVPIVVVFTKCEALEHEAVNVLEEQGYSFKDAVKGSADYAKKHLQTAHLKLQNYKYQPQGYVYLQEMDKPNTSCKTLAECTADVLNSSNLQAIFVSTQQVSIELSVCYAMRSVAE